jgi:tRNA 2-thiouridine synthesizing protein B
MLYLVDKPMADLAVRTAAGDDEAVVVLIQDGVVLDPRSELDSDVPIYAVRRDVAVRGVDLPAGIEPIDYERVVELTLEHGVRNFL